MRTTILAAAGLLSTALLSGPAASAEGETCRGEVATHVGTAQSTVTGTEGRDIVVSAGARVVDTRGGDDLVCVTDGVETFVATGNGADVVDASAAGATFLSVTLGNGDDTFHGAAQDLSVRAGNVGFVDGEADGGADVIRVGSLPGARTVVESGQPDLPNADVVRLAGGGDVRWNGPMTPGSELAGGAGPNRLRTTLPAGAVRVDLHAGAAGAVGTGGTWGLRWTGFESFLFEDVAGVVTALDLAGSPKADLVELRLLDTTTRVTAAMGRGDDILDTTIVGATGSSYRGGAGLDRLGVATFGNVDLDLASGRLWARVNGAATRAEVTSFRDAHVWGRTVRIVGDRRSNVLTAGGCRGSHVEGRGGADDVDYRREAPFDGRSCSNPAPVRFAGGSGKDLLVGGPTDDILVGGRGRDRAIGGEGHDRCLTERSSTCEVRR